MKAKIPKGYKLQEVKVWKDKSEPPDTMYWVWKGTEAKRYTESSSEEVLNWVRELYDGFSLQAQGALDLLVVRAVILDSLLIRQSFLHSNLLGKEHLETDEFFMRLREANEKE